MSKLFAPSGAEYFDIRTESYYKKQGKVWFRYSGGWHISTLDNNYVNSLIDDGMFEPVFNNKHGVLALIILISCAVSLVGGVASWFI